MTSLFLDGVSGGYTVVDVVHGVSLRADTSRVTGLIGVNGAGKTAALLLAVCALRLSAGRIMVDDEDMTACATRDIVGRGVVYVPEGRGLFPTMSVEDNLLMGAYRKAARRHVKASRDYVFDLFPRLADRRTQTAGHLSGGEQQMLAIGRGLMAKPGLLILDEPSLGLAPAIVALVGATIRQIAADGVGVLLCEQNASMTFELADSVVVMDQGRVALTGRTQDLRADPRVQDAFLSVNG